ncbi:MotA/TolQ/ExbB proton channel family protein [Stutzerimonas nosocomialis]|uniref:MotA/TolQ/ExbB proton channel family protein n=1 Tax=Stutzerimonas nosocomialis TaxID=1056496 RepID=A0A5R9QGM6_9GAMM|nr:MotA/TolQ/ExbB proton channel family protein [Stutzerimonas nosocomialis]TLX55131.1 MotA/TolQ/ExbB proton channel family protein [Stutzerimonas nosocomialis]TLX56979.1 MotA/TolQ/ExbB proton channel family protein [Stutzerimonas nosocomialis]TLX64369.1 MotA/TolQ/ExbB proton channel family protein [Stutzerimonas nosocomialis]
MTDFHIHWLRLVDSGYALLDFMSAGGMVMWALAALCVVYWTLVFERLWFMRRVFPRWVEERRAAWHRLELSHSRQRAVRSAWLAQAQQQLTMPLRLSKTLVAMYPLLGLLGTVTGMIAVFDVLALNGTGNPRGMAAGVWQATLPTMAGMVLAITGLFSLARLERNARQALDRLADQLRHD